MKGDHTLVTAADIAADRFLTQAIQENYPGDDLISEETQTVFPGNRGRPLWVIDPLDGTTNFSLGLYYWGVSIARLDDAGPQIAALYFPMLDEMYSAQIGKGAFFNGERMQVKAPSGQNTAPFFACCGHTPKDYDLRIPYKIRILGCAAYTFCCVARGIALLGFEARPKIWDIAATWLVVQEAGGVITSYNSEPPFPLQAGRDYSQIKYPTLAAANEQLLDRARGWIHPKTNASFSE